jgi:hypothetical protein
MLCMLNIRKEILPLCTLHQPSCREKSDTGNRYYGISAGIATLALAYGSVPMYKMVSLQFGKASPVLKVFTDMSANRLVWSTC